MLLPALDVKLCKNFFKNLQKSRKFWEKLQDDRELSSRTFSCFATGERRPRSESLGGVFIEFSVPILVIIGIGVSEKVQAAQGRRPGAKPKEAHLFKAFFFFSRILTWTPDDKQLFWQKFL